MAPAAPTHDYYAVLEVQPSATHDIIRASYRRLALLHHPDKNAGSKASTVKFQLINTAWDTLQDITLRREYDLKYQKASPTANTAYTSTKPQPAKPQPSKPSPKPDSSAQDDAKARAAEAKAQAESRAKKQEWLTFKMIQEQNIRQCQRRIKELEAAIAGLNATIDANRAKLDNDEPYWWNAFASWMKRLSEEEKNKLRREIMDKGAVIRIKEEPLDRESARLVQLEGELERRRAKEDARVAIELQEKERKERVARERAEAERKRAEAERQRKHYEEEARIRAAREKAEAERLQKYWEEVAKQNAAREKAEEERRQRMAKEQVARKAKEEARRKEQEETNRRMRETQREAAAQRQRCLHNMFWPKVQGQQVCTGCSYTTTKFAFRCPGCSTTACHDCMKDLKAGTPTHKRAADRARQAPRKPKQNKARPTYTYDPYDDTYIPEWVG